MPTLPTLMHKFFLSLYIQYGHKAQLRLCMKLTHVFQAVICNLSIDMVKSYTIRHKFNIGFINNYLSKFQRFFNDVTYESVI